MKTSTDILGMLLGKPGSGIAATQAYVMYLLFLVHQWDTEATLSPWVLPTMPGSLQQS